MATLLQPSQILASAPLSWTDLEPTCGGVIVNATWRAGTRSHEFLLTADIEIDTETFEVCKVVGPQPDPTTAVELCADVQRAIESGVGVRYRDLALAVCS